MKANNTVQALCENDLMKEKITLPPQYDKNKTLECHTEIINTNQVSYKRMSKTGASESLLEKLRRLQDHSSNMVRGN